MKSQGSYVPPPYILLGQSNRDPEEIAPNTADVSANRPMGADPTQWSCGICACFDDMQSYCIGLFCPCYLFGKNAEFLGSGTLMGSCTTHFLLWSLVNTICCLITNGILLGLPGCFVACYACGYHQALRSKYNLEEAPCGDFVTHFFCHSCAISQEYREICERAGELGSSDLFLTVVTAPSVQTMDSTPK